jgi:nucleoside-diphosphate-sugar epimerase
LKILIIGGTGLISSAITRELLECGYDVTHYNRGMSEARFEGDVRRITGDRRDFTAFEAQVAEAGTFDCVIDMICYTAQEAESDVRAFRGRAGQVIFCSTVDVYSKPASRYPYQEDEPLQGRGDYATNKVACEKIFNDAHAQGVFPVTIIRPAHTYGEGSGLIHTLGWSTTFLDRLRKGKPVVVHGDGSSLWVSCHIDDVGHAFVKAIGNPVAMGKSYHTTGEEWMTWNNYYQKAAQALGAPEPQLVHIPTDFLFEVARDRSWVIRDNFQYNNIFDNSAAARVLDFRYTIPFVEGARRTIRWLDERNGIQDCSTDPFDDHLIKTWRDVTKIAKARIAKP